MGRTRTATAQQQLSILTPIHDKRVFKQVLQAMNVGLRDSEGGGIVERFDTISRALFAKVFDEREVEQGVKRDYEFRITPSDTADSVHERLTLLWTRICSNYDGLFAEPAGGITSDRSGLSRIAEVLGPLSLLSTPGDIKGVAYEEILRNTFEKNENQQFFTPHEVVAFMVQMTAISPGSRICDPACGTGGFVVEAARTCGATVGLVGADVDARLARVAQMNLIMHGVEDARVYWLRGSGSLAPLEDIAPALPRASFDVILTNPPFGSDLTDEGALSQFETGAGRPSRRRSVLFVERCLDLLKPGGRLAIVLDDSVLNLASNADIRTVIRQRSIVEAVVSLPDVAFMPYSTAKSSLLFVRKKMSPSEQQAKVFMAEAEEVGRRGNGDPLYSDDRDDAGNRILLNDLPAIAKRCRSTQSRFRTPGPLCFTLPANRISDRLDIYYYHPKRALAESEIRSSKWPTPPLRELVTIRRESINPAESLGDSPIRWVGLGDVSEATGEYEEKVISGDKIRSAAHVFAAGDILFSRLRPNLRKVIFVPSHDEGGVCSGEFMVLIANTSDGANAVDPDYLAFMLRSDLVYGQLMYQITGIGRPRVSLEAMLSLRIPMPPLDEQRSLARVFKEAWKEALAARHKALQWQARTQERMSEAYDTVVSRLVKAGENGHATD